MSLSSPKRKAVKTVGHVALAVTLVAAPVPLPLFWSADDAAFARSRGGGGARGARAGKSKSAIERAPRSASAAKGSVRQANRGADRRQVSDRHQVARAERRPATARPERQRSAERTAARESEQATRWERRDERTAGADARREERSAAGETRRDERSEQAAARRAEAEGRRADRTATREEARDQRSEALQDLQENRRDSLEALQDDRQDFAEDLADEREELWEEVYDDRDYWDDDDNEWLWGIVGGLAGGVAGYAIGPAVNAPPEGAVSVPVAGAAQPYEYYGGAFYQPAPEGEGYVTAPAPVGATVDAPPLDCTIVYGPPPDEIGYCYFQGPFFTYNDDIGQYVVADPRRRDGALSAGGLHGRRGWWGELSEARRSLLPAVLRGRRVAVRGGGPLKPNVLAGWHSWHPAGRDAHAG